MTKAGEASTAASMHGCCSEYAGVPKKEARLKLARKKVHGGNGERPDWAHIHHPTYISVATRWYQRAGWVEGGKQGVLLWAHMNGVTWYSSVARRPRQATVVGCV